VATVFVSHASADGALADEVCVWLQALPPSTLTLAGLLNHLALVEDWWFRVRFLGLAEAEPWASVDWDADPTGSFTPRPIWSPAPALQGGVCPQPRRGRGHRRP
jgi:hypothetical protein